MVDRYLKNGLQFEIDKLGIFGRNNRESIIFRIRKNRGWLVKVAKDSTHSAGVYGNNWNGDFTEQITYDELTPEEQKTLIQIAIENFNNMNLRILDNVLGTNIFDNTITISSNIIDIDNILMFDISTVDRVRYEDYALILVFKNGSEEELPYTKDIKKILLENLTKSSKKMI